MSSILTSLTGVDLTRLSPFVSLHAGHVVLSMPPTCISTHEQRPVQVRSRAQDLRTSLDEVVRALAGSAHLLQWEACAKKMATINLQV